MKQKRGMIRLLPLVLAFVMLLSAVTAASAVDPGDVVDAKDEIARVDLIQVYNGDTVDAATHNYHLQGEEVLIDYSATLQMTEAMATYLNVRQTQLKNAKFNVHINVEMDKIEFVDEVVTVTFTSSFLKPWSYSGGYTVEYPDAFGSEAEYISSGYAVEFLGRDGDGMFTYAITVDKDWAESKTTFDIPMELITYYDEALNVAYGYEEVEPLRQYAYEPMMYSDFTVDDWMKPITLKVANMQVREEIAETVTYDRDTWIYVRASGTVDGEFTYVPGKSGQIESLRKWGSETTMEFGNDNTIEEWNSNEVYVRLIRSERDVDGGGVESPWLNLDDHFAYIIGYPDGEVKPQGTITRAEVATIFFRMLHDDVRETYWCQTNPYNDVELNDWFNNAISTLTNLGVINGYPDGSFQPNGNITRAEFAAMAVRFFEHTEELKYEDDAFTDIEGHWANPYINMAYLLEIVNGYPDGTYRPQQAITRAEAMTIVNNTLRRTPCVEGIDVIDEHEDFITWPDNMDETVWYYAAVQEATNSHHYDYFTEPQELWGCECWTDILPVRDWAAFERAWSDAYSAANPGEVVGGNDHVDTYDPVAP